jgi:hypothetical protein
MEPVLVESDNAEETKTGKVIGSLLIAALFSFTTVSWVNLFFFLISFDSVGYKFSVLGNLTSLFSVLGCSYMIHILSKKKLILNIVPCIAGALLFWAIDAFDLTSVMPFLFIPVFFLGLLSIGLLTAWIRDVFLRILS